jgi:glycosyltransferase involved in cell wall biosynthesis
VLLFPRLGSGAGGEGTLTDWAKAILQNGDDCDVLVGKSTLRQRLRLGHQIRRFVGSTPGKLVISPLCRLVDLRVAPSVLSSDFVSRGKRRWTTVRFLLDPRRIRAQKLLQRAETVLVGHECSPRGLRELRVASKSAHLVLHHNGDPLDFSKDWLRRSSSRVQPHAGDGQTYFEAFSSVVFQSEAHQEIFSEMYQTARQNTAVIWPSCDERKAEQCADRYSPFDPEHFNLVGVGKFQPIKNQLDILKAFLAISDKYPALHLTLLGDSIADRTYLNECVEFVVLNGLSSRVSLLGYRGDAMRYLAHADVFVHFSIADGVSRAIREAAFLKTPMVVSNDAGARSFLGPEGALCVDPSNVDQATQAISAFVDSVESRDGYAEAANLQYSSKSSWHLFVLNVRNFLDAIDHGSTV